jgi:hypothetical protein
MLDSMALLPVQTAKRVKDRFEFIRDPAFRVKFPERIDLRFALLFHDVTNIPKSVRSALRYEKCRHVTSHNGRCAGFALGSSYIENGQLSWFILALQSDLAFSRQAVLRGYVRGWRIFLFGRIIDAARRSGVKTILLLPSEEVCRSAHFARPRSHSGPPPSWQTIYDRTALDFGMDSLRLTRPLNIQVMPRRRSCLGQTFYKLDINRKWSSEWEVRDEGFRSSTGVL